MSDLQALVSEALATIEAATDAAALEQARVQYLGKKSLMTELSKGMGQLDPEARKAQGARLNEVRTAINTALDTRKAALAEAALNAQLAAERIDVTLPGRGQPPPGLHPVTRVMNRIT